MYKYLDMVHPHVRLEHRPVLPVEEIKREAEPPIRKLRTCSPQFSARMWPVSVSVCAVQMWPDSVSVCAVPAQMWLVSVSVRRCGRFQFQCAVPAQMWPDSVLACAPRADASVVASLAHIAALTANASCGGHSAANWPGKRETSERIDAQTV